MRGNIKSFEKSFTHAEVITLAERTLKRFGGDRNKAGRYARSMENRYESSKWAQVVEVLATSRQHHATRKTSAQLQREINEVLAPARDAHATSRVQREQATSTDPDPAGKELTAAQRRALGNIVALGGARGTGMGSDRPGAVRESVVLSLFRMGLVEPDPTGPRFPDGSLIIGTRTTVWQATAAGIRAFGREVARVT